MLVDCIGDPWVSNSLRGASDILSIVHAHLIFEQYVINFMLYHTLFRIFKFPFEAATV